LFGISVVVDLADIDDNWWGVLLEDGAKFTGIIVWATYHARSACGALKAARPN
jgi:predicted metalloprotease